MTMKDNSPLFKQDENCLTCGAKGGPHVGWWHKPTCAFYKPYQTKERRFMDSKLEESFSKIFGAP